MYWENEKSACGVGFVSALSERGVDQVMGLALGALERLEHRGGVAADGISSDGAGILCEIPFSLLGIERGQTAVAMLFLSGEDTQQAEARKIFEETFAFLGLVVARYREVPVHEVILGPVAAGCKPKIVQAMITRPEFCTNLATFEERLYEAGRKTRTRLSERDLSQYFYFASLSARTIVYKALTRSFDLPRFYPDLTHNDFVSRFAVFHRRFSTNTSSSWKAAQPFRLIAHNGEINTITGNRSIAASREMSLGMPCEELMARSDISDTGSMDEAAEALKYKACMSGMRDIAAILMPPAHGDSPYYRFWSRAMEPWDGPALVCYGDGEQVGARLDRNGFRPCRYYRTADHFLLASEAGPFKISENQILARGSLSGGRGVMVSLEDGQVDFQDPGFEDAKGQGKISVMPVHKQPGEPRAPEVGEHLHKKHMFQFTKEDLDRVLMPMILEGKEAIGSMGDTARSASLSDQPRSFFDYFYQNFAQVTNPPLDYLREKMVTDLRVNLGRRPNIYNPAELLQPSDCIQLEGPVLSLGQMNHLLAEGEELLGKGAVKSLSLTFERSSGAEGLDERLNALEGEAIRATRGGARILILSDRHAGGSRVPIPSLLGLRAVVKGLNSKGLRLAASVVVDSGEIRETHHVAALVGFGAAAVCPYLAAEIARFEESGKLKKLDPEVKERNLMHALSMGLLKIMAKMGISVVSGYRSAKLFTPIGLSNDLVSRFFPGLKSPIGGANLQELALTILKRTQPTDLKTVHTYQYKEHNRGLTGEKHAMTNRASKLIHTMVRDAATVDEERELFGTYLQTLEDSAPVHPRHLLAARESETPLPLVQVEGAREILSRFGAGAMSFGAISAESQRDIFQAMREIGGRANSGEGGENPYYFDAGIEADVKQIASGRFGVTAEYLMGGREIQIKMAQGAKPGEGGQLMGVKVNADIARARHAKPGMDLISPPPMHDIYSIEDLAGLIYELKQLKPGTKVSVKLASGSGVGTIALGVAKAGADIIHISGGDGGTGAASLSSMKHAGLAWELGLVETHRMLAKNGLRDSVTLRVDGGLHTGRDVMLAALLGAQEYDFGKLLLVAEGCVMARICEKNTCPTGIATHDPKFKAKYKGEASHVAKVLRHLAEDVRARLAFMGQRSLEDIVGRTDLLQIYPKHEGLAREKGLDLSLFLSDSLPLSEPTDSLYPVKVSELNQKILEDTFSEARREDEQYLSYDIHNTDRGVTATLSGKIAELRRERRKLRRMDPEVTPFESVSLGGKKYLTFRGSAGQGFGAFLEETLTLDLIGEANDGVGKSMCGGTIIVRPAAHESRDSSQQTIVGNVALYGATKGKLLVAGRAGDRFAVRNSGAVAIAEGAGLHACEYMTGGTVLLLGEVGENLGAGMTGGRLFVYNQTHLAYHEDYLAETELTANDEATLRWMISDFRQKTMSELADHILGQWEDAFGRFCKFVPAKEVAENLGASPMQVRAIAK